SLNSWKVMIMNNRFAPELPKLRKVLTDLKSTLAHTVTSAEQLWVEAFSAVIGSSPSSMSVDEVRNTLLTIITARVELPCEFYDLVSELIKNLPAATRENI